MVASLALLALLLVIVLIVVAFFVSNATLILCLAGFLLAVYALPALPWVPIAAASWFLIQIVEGLKAAIATAKAKQKPPDA